MEHFKKFERFVQNKADTLRNEFDANRPAKILKQVECIARALGALPHSASLDQPSSAGSSDGYVSAAALMPHHIPTAIFKASSAVATPASSAAPSLSANSSRAEDVSEEVSRLLSSCRLDDTTNVNGHNLSLLLRMLCGPAGSWSTVLRHLSLEKIPLAPVIQSVNQLIASHTGANLTHITLRGTCLADDSVSYLVDALLSCAAPSRLVELDVSWNLISMASPIAKLLVLHPSLECIDLSHNFLGSTSPNVAGQPAAARPSRASSLLSELATKLENKLHGKRDAPDNDHRSMASGNCIDEDRATTSRFFAEDEGDAAPPACSNAAPSAEVQEPMYFLIRELIRPRDDCWTPDSMWAGTIKTVVAVDNGVSVECAAAIQRLLDRDCHAINERAAQEKHLRQSLQCDRPQDEMTENNGDQSAELASLITEDTAHLFVPALRFSRLILSREQHYLAGLSDAASDGRGALVSNVSYVPNGGSIASSSDSSLNSLNRTVARRRQCIRRWLRGEDVAIQSPLVEGKPNVPLLEMTHAPVADACGPPEHLQEGGNPSVPRAEMSSIEFEPTQQQQPVTRRSPSSAESMCNTSAHVCSLELEVEAILQMTNSFVTATAEVSSLLAQHVQEFFALRHRQLVHEMELTHAATLRSASVDYERERAAARDEQKRLLECAAVEKRRADRLAQEARDQQSIQDDLFRRAMEQIKTWDEVMRSAASDEAQPDGEHRPKVTTTTSVACGTELRMVELEEWRQEKIRSRQDRRCRRRAEEPTRAPPATAALQERAPPSPQQSGGSDPTTDAPDGCASSPRAEHRGCTPQSHDDTVPDSTDTFEIVLRTDDSFAMMTKDRWQRDTEATNCNQCARQFGLMHRRHHCRRCGGVYCSKCAPKSAMHGDVRICKHCTTKGSSSRSNSVAPSVARGGQ